ncbi:MAG: hypothetical protein JNL72_11945 [Flavipsychrobacter sp.]|nr:hypothetical protein [Flavipsychrobacter sp.]
MKYLLLACATALVVISCNKEQTLDVPLNRTQKLYGNNKTDAAPEMPTRWTTKEYRVVFTKLDGSDSVVTDLQTACKKDDFLQFFENYSGKHHTANDKCSTGEGDIYNFRWEFSDNDDSLNFYNCDRYFDYRTFKVSVKDFSDGEFTIAYPAPFIVNNVPVDTVRIEHVFQKN